MSDMPQQTDRRPGRRPPTSPPSPVRPERRAAIRLASADDRFFRHIVSSMRNGVIAFRRDGTLALMNDEAYRTFDLTPSPTDLGRPFADVLRERPEVVRVLSSACELSQRPNRAGLRSRELHGG